MQMQHVRMKTGKSSLNANAASYVPLCKRGAAGEKQEHALTVKGSEISCATGWSEFHPANFTANYHASKASQSYLDDNNSHSKVHSWKATDAHGSYASSSKSREEVLHNDFVGEDFDMDYLQMAFPEFSDECLSHMYMANWGDLENTVDMLNQLELSTDDYSELLPDSLDIGETSESQSSKECASLKLKEVADEISGSAGSTNQHPVPN